MSSSCCAKHPEKKWYEKKLFLVCMGLLLSVPLVAIGFSQPKLLDYFVMMLGFMWWAVLLGLFIGGFIDYVIPSYFVEDLLSRGKKRHILTAVGLGILFSTCCHGILAIAVQLYRKGAATSSVVALLLAAPWANVPMTILLLRFFGFGGWMIVLSAVLIAIITGLLFLGFEKSGVLSANPNVSSDEEKPNLSFSGFMKQSWSNYSFSFSRLWADLGQITKRSWDLSQMVLWWLGIALVIATYIQAYVPSEFFIRYLSESLSGMGMTLLSATVLEICSEGTSLLGFEMFRQVGALGNVFLFLMAGVATDYTEIGLIWTNIGKKEALLLPLVTIPQIFIIAYLMNQFL